MMQITTSTCDDVMEKNFRIFKGLGCTTAANKEEFYGFEACQIVYAYSQKNGHAHGVFFRLVDGRVFDTCGRQHDPDPGMYDQTTH
jgi:hypothetical protein